MHWWVSSPSFHAVQSVVYQRFWFRYMFNMETIMLNVCFSNFVYLTNEIALSLDLSVFSSAFFFALSEIAVALKAITQCKRNRLPCTWKANEMFRIHLAECWNVKTRNADGLRFVAISQKKKKKKKRNNCDYFIWRNGIAVKDFARKNPLDGERNENARTR